MEIREVRSDEYEAAGEVAVAGYADYYGDDLGDYADRLRDVVSRTKDAVLLVAIEVDEIVGTVTYVGDSASSSAVELGDDEAMIRMLSVAPEHKRRGVGRRLSSACVERARAEGKRRVVLHADERMDASQRLYKGLGFRRAPERDFRPDDQTVRAVGSYTHQSNVPNWLCTRGMWASSPGRQSRYGPPDITSITSPVSQKRAF